MSTTVDEEIVAWVRSLPDGTEIHWYEDKSPPWRKWVDVHVDALEGFNWVWTITSVADPDPAPDDIVWPFDIETPDGPAWSVDAINEAVTQWCATHAERRVVPVFEPDHDPSPMVAAALATMDAIQAGTEDTYLVAPGEAEGGTGMTIRASGQAMGFLLQDFIDETPDA